MTKKSKDMFVTIFWEWPICCFPPKTHSNILFLFALLETKITLCRAGLWGQCNVNLSTNDSSLVWCSFIHLCKGLNAGFVLQKIMHTRKRHQDMFQDLNRKLQHAEKDRDSPPVDGKTGKRWSVSSGGSDKTNLSVRTYINHSPSFSICH